MKFNTENVDQSNEIVFDTPDEPDDNFDVAEGMESIHTLFHLFGETIPDAELAWFFSMGANNAIEVIRLRTQPSDKLYDLMKASDIILQGY
jgi:hypothetical protein